MNKLVVYRTTTTGAKEIEHVCYHANLAKLENFVYELSILVHYYERVLRHQVTTTSGTLDYVITENEHVNFFDTNYVLADDASPSIQLIVRHYSDTNTVELQSGLLCTTTDERKFAYRIATYPSLRELCIYARYTDKDAFNDDYYLNLLFNELDMYENMNLEDTLLLETLSEWHNTYVESLIDDYLD